MKKLLQTSLLTLLFLVFISFPYVHSSEEEETYPEDNNIFLNESEIGQNEIKEDSVPQFDKRDISSKQDTKTQIEFKINGKSIKVNKQSTFQEVKKELKNKNIEVPQAIVLKSKDGEKEIIYLNDDEDLKKKLIDFSISDGEDINSAGMFDMHKIKIIFGLTSLVLAVGGAAAFFLLSESSDNNNKNYQF